MDRPLGSVDVLDHRIDRCIAVGGKKRLIPAGRRQVVDTSSKRERRGIEARVQLSDNPIVAGWPRELGLYFAPFFTTFQADSDFAQEKIGEDSDDGQGDDDDSPSDPRRGLAVWPQDRANEYRHLGNGQ